MNLSGLSGDIRTVFFDAAGTLFRVRGSVGAIYARLVQSNDLAAFRDKGLPASEFVTPESVERLNQAFKQAFQSKEPLLFPEATDAELPQLERSWWREIVDETFSSLGLPVEDRLFDRLFSFFARSDAWQLEPGCRRTIATLTKKGYQLGVISNFDSRLESLLENLGLRPFFSNVTVSTRIRMAKPDPEVFRVALKEAGVRAEAAVHVGNHLIEDYQAARRAGLQAILYDPNDTAPEVSPRVTRLMQLVESGGVGS